MWLVFGLLTVKDDRPRLWAAGDCTTRCNRLIFINWDRISLHGHAQWVWVRWRSTACYLTDRLCRMDAINQISNHTVNTDRCTLVPSIASVLSKSCIVSACVHWYLYFYFASRHVMALFCAVRGIIVQITASGQPVVRVTVGYVLSKVNLYCPKKYRAIRVRRLYMTVGWSEGERLSSFVRKLVLHISYAVTANS